MSHFTVLVIGDNVEKQLAPFDERLKVEWIDKTEENRKEYETKTTKEFYCSSSSSWGQQITKELFDKINSSKTGALIKYKVEKQNSGFGHYFENGKEYCGYYELEGRNRCEGDAWFKVVSIDKTTHPNDNVCFDGEITVRVIDAPKEITLKEKYPDYQTFLTDWHGYEPGEEQGYWNNPKAKWDWYQIGGRWTGMLKLKQGVAEYSVGEPGIMTDEAEPGTADQARKCDIDFDKIREDDFENYSQLYDKFEELYKKDPEQARKDAYWDYGIENNGDRDNYIPETREEFLKRGVGFSTFAVIKDGEWYEKGEMGWFGVVSDEKGDWIDRFNKMLDELPDDTLLTVVDCHI